MTPNMNPRQEDSSAAADHGRSIYGKDTGDGEEHRIEVNILTNFDARSIRNMHPGTEVID